MARFFKNGAEAERKVIFTVVGSTASTLFTPLLAASSPNTKDAYGMSELRLGSSWRSMDAFTASALNSVPSWNLTPSRSLMVYVRPSSEISGRSAARQGDTLASVLPYWYRPSWMLQDTTADSPSSKYAGSTARGSAVRLYVMVSDIPLGASPPPWPSAGFSPPPPPQPAMLTRPKLAAETPSSSTNRRLLNACLLASMCSPSLKPRFSGALQRAPARSGS